VSRQPENLSKRKFPELPLLKMQYPSNRSHGGARMGARIISLTKSDKLLNYSEWKHIEAISN